MIDVSEERSGFAIFVEDGKAVRVEDFGLPLVEHLSREHLEPFVELIRKSIEKDLASETLSA